MPPRNQQVATELESPVAEAQIEQPTKAELKPKHVEEYLRYDFTEDEMKERAQELARALQEKENAESSQKAVQAQFKERIERQIATISRVSREYQNGHEYRNIKCSVEYHTPTVGSKRITRLDTGEHVRDTAMSHHELQEVLDFENANNPDPEVG